MELWDLYTEERVLTWKTHARGEDIPDGFYHLVVHVWIKNSDGKYLISQRSADRKSYPLFWECPGGSVLKGETSREGALREVKEEIGIDLSDADGTILFSEVRKTVGGEKFNDIMDVWLFYYDGDADLSAATTAEVCRTEWLTKEQISELYGNNKMVYTLDYFFDESKMR